MRGSRVEYLKPLKDDSSQDSRSVDLDESERKSQTEGPLCLGMRYACVSRRTCAKGGYSRLNCKV
jgi:hypothetical protein